MEYFTSIFYIQYSIFIINQMKKTFLFIFTILLSGYCMAQAELSFPFQGGKDVMTRFFKDSLTVSQQIIAKKATGTAIFKFTADENGTIKKVIIYYADDLVLAEPAIEALKKSNHKWIIPDHEKVHDFIVPFVFTFTPPAVSSAALQRSVYDFYRSRKPVLTSNQVPLDLATLLPAITVNYTVAP